MVRSDDESRRAHPPRSVHSTRCARATGIHRTPPAARRNDRDDGDALYADALWRRGGSRRVSKRSFYYFLGETLHDGKPVVRLVRRAGSKDGGAEVTIAEAPLAQHGNAPLLLRITARGAKYDFSYAYEPNEWRPLARDVDGTILSTHVAGGFVGTVIGTYAYASPSAPPD